LEIGAGSGIATVELAKMGCKVTAIEPGANLAEIAREQTHDFKDVEILEGTFENFQTQDRFDAVFAFTAFHWLREGDRHQKVLDLLNDSGSFVLVWNSFFQSDSPATSEVNQAYNEFLPDAYPEESRISEVNKGVLSKLNRREREITENPLFYPVFLRKYLTTYNYDWETFPKLLNTFPKVVEVEEARRHKFFLRISEIVKEHGKIAMPVLSTLIICKGRKHFLEILSKS
jgi:protein-L-isoaspartate O-methyltransferase